MGEQTFDASAVGLIDSVVEYHEFNTGTRLMRLGAVARLDAASAYSYDGYPSTSAFLAHRCGMSSGEASREVFLARSLEHMGYAVKAAYAGNISLTQLELLAHARQRHPEIFAEDEESPTHRPNSP